MENKLFMQNLWHASSSSSSWHIYQETGSKLSKTTEAYTGNGRMGIDEELTFPCLLYIFFFLSSFLFIHTYRDYCIYVMNSSVWWVSHRGIATLSWTAGFFMLYIFGNAYFFLFSFYVYMHIQIKPLRSFQSSNQHVYDKC